MFYTDRNTGKHHEVLMAGHGSGGGRRGVFSVWTRAAAVGSSGFPAAENGGCCHKTFDVFGNMRYDTRMEMTVVTDKSLQGGASALKIGGSGDVADLRLNTENQRERGE